MSYNLLTHDDLVARAVKWAAARYPVVLSEYSTASGEIPDVISFRNRESCVIECKVSRQDFMADKYKPHRQGAKQMGNYRWYMVLPSILCAADIPDGWGLLYVEANRIKKVKDAIFHNEPEIRAAEHTILYSVVRRIQIRGLLSKVQEPL